MLQRTPPFGIILEMLPARRALSGACRTADGSRPARLSPIAVPLLKRGRIHANVLCGAQLYPHPAPMLPGPATRFTTLNRPQAAGAVK